MKLLERGKTLNQKLHLSSDEKRHCFKLNTEYLFAWKVNTVFISFCRFFRFSTLISLCTGSSKV